MGKNNNKQQPSKLQQQQQQNKMTHKIFGCHSIMRINVCMPFVGNFFSLVVWPSDMRALSLSHEQNTNTNIY